MTSNGKFMLLGIFLLSLVFGLAGCASDNKTTANTAKPADNKATETKPADNKAAETKPAAETASGDSIGIAECDDFIKKYEACISSKVPEAARASYKTGIDAWRKSWKDLAANPQTKSTLADVCKRSLEDTKKAMTSFNCEW